MKLHTTTTHLGTYLRMGILVLVSVALAYFLPHMEGDGYIDFFATAGVNIGILYAMTIGFLMMLAINRKVALDTCVSIELNKIRRLHHIAIHISQATPGLTGWVKEIDTAIAKYLTAFGKRDFDDYDDGNAYARDITYAIYKLPQLTADYPGELYETLLDATADFTGAREDIRALKDTSIGYFQWFVMAGITILLSFLLVLSVPLIRSCGLLAA